MSHLPTPSQTVGPFFSIGLSALCRNDIECGYEGQRIVIRGRILDGDGQPVPDAILEIWQAGAAGLGAGGETADARHKAIPAGFARVGSDEQGQFRFSTVLPPTRCDNDGSVHAPHVVVILLMRGLLRHLLTRIYFAGEPANANDAVLNLVPAERRPTLLAGVAKEGGNELSWDIHLQGGRETVFFEA